MILLDGNSLTLDQLLAIEVLCACQAIDLVAPPTTADPLARVRHRVRKKLRHSLTTACSRATFARSHN